MKKYIIIFTLILIAGCSSGPSDKDVENNLTNLFNGTCKIAKIENAKKINGIKLSDSTYDLKISFDVVIDPVPEVKNELENYNKKTERAKFLRGELEKEFEPINIKYADLMKKFSEDSDNNSLDSEKVYEQTGVFISNKNSELKAIEDKYNEISKKEDLDLPALESKLNRTVAEIDRNCNTNEFGKKLIYSTRGVNSIAAYSKGAKSSFSHNLNMIKTDNGWQFDL